MKKFVYNRFTKAFSETLLIILLVIMFLGLEVLSEINTDNIIDGISVDDFEDTNIAMILSDNNSAAIMNILVSSMENEYQNEIANNAEDKAKKGDTDKNGGENETVSDSAYSDTDEPEDIYNEDDDDISVVSIYGYYYEDSIIESANVLKYAESEKVKRILLEEAGKRYVNYHFEVIINENVVITDIEDKSTVNYVNQSEHYIGVYDNIDSKITIKNYINKNIVKGDNLYAYNRVYSFIKDNFNSILMIAMTAVIIIIVLLVHQLVTAGYKEDGTIGTGWTDNIPIEFFAVLFILLTLGIMETYSYCNEIQISSVFQIVVFLGAYITLIITIVKTVLSRLKNHIFIKKSLIGRCIIALKEIVKEACSNINTKVKAVIAIEMNLVLEAVLVLMIMETVYSGMALYFVWFIIKLVQAVLVLKIYSMIQRIRNGAREMHNGAMEVQIDTEGMRGILLESAEYMNDVFTGLDRAVEEKMKSEQLKTELITNVSHDIKTPLTSIINYIDLMKKEEIDNEKVKEYLQIADKQSIRLKKLTEDIIEASKAATGNINVEMTKININEMVSQALGEYEEKFSKLNLSVVFEEDGQYEVNADGRLLWRVLDNLFSNIYKYTLEGTRLYIKISENGENVVLQVKNISKYQLNISSDELKQRFVRGDVSRSTSGNGLGLSIAESLIKLQEGVLNIDINGDLFVAEIILKKINRE